HSIRRPDASLLRARRCDPFRHDSQTEERLIPTLFEHRVHLSPIQFIETVAVCVRMFPPRATDRTQRPRFGPSLVTAIDIDITASAHRLDGHGAGRSHNDAVLLPSPLPGAIALDGAGSRLAPSCRGGI